jgi:hypothetical protein
VFWACHRFDADKASILGDLTALPRPGVLLAGFNLAW